MGLYSTDPGPKPKDSEIGKNKEMHEFRADNFKNKLN
jgi:hypothetical protein